MRARPRDVLVVRVQRQRPCSGQLVVPLERHVTLGLRHHVLLVVQDAGVCAPGRRAAEVSSGLHLVTLSNAIHAHRTDRDVGDHRALGGIQQDLLVEHHHPRHGVPAADVAVAGDVELVDRLPGDEQRRGSVDVTGHVVR